MHRLVQLCSRFFLRYMPDAFVVAVLLSLLTFALAVGVAGYGVTETIDSWGSGFWKLLAFTNQITLTLLFGYAVANTPPAKRALDRVASWVRTPGAAYLLACFVSGVCALINWGLSLIAAGILSRSLGEACRKRGIKVHYPLLVASAFAGFVIWHQGFSSSIGLSIATQGHPLQQQIGIVPTSQTLFTVWNVGLALAVLLTLPFVMRALRPRVAAEVEEMVEVPEVAAFEARAGNADEPPTPAERLERSWVLNLVVIAIGAVFVYRHFVIREQDLTLDVFNLMFLLAGLLLAGSPIRYVQIIVEGGRVAAPFLLQYPFYAGIAGVMADSGLAKMLVDLFVRLSSAGTLPFFAFLSGGLLNLFIPSGGGQWAVQGPIMMSAALKLGANVPRTAMAVALGDQWTNLIQPLAIIPVVTLARIPVKAIMSYTFVALFWSGLLFALALLLL